MLNLATMSAVPVLLIVFRRRELASRVFETIRQAKPQRLYVAADGPRNLSGEPEACRRTREAVTSVDWPCQLRTNFQTDNLGCRRGVIAAIDWFFQNEPEGIILEEDCEPHPSFFPYCESLLDRFRSDPRIMCISGAAGSPATRYPCAASYRFSKHVSIWGWASWRRAWALYDRDMLNWPRFQQEGHFARFTDGSAQFGERWRSVFQLVADGKIDTWDYQWVFSTWLQDGLAVLPAENLVCNIGFGADATHTTDPYHHDAGLPASGVTFPLRHPDAISRDIAFDRAMDANKFARKTIGKRIWKSFRKRRDQIKSLVEQL